MNPRAFALSASLSLLAVALAPTCAFADGDMDRDRDGFDEEEDCDDHQPCSLPLSDDLCDGVDNDCDGLVDEDDAVDAATWNIDHDGDGWGSSSDTQAACDQPSGYVASGAATDCDDDAAAINPGADEVCDGADNDCDGAVDEDDALDASSWFQDDDGDGWGLASDSTTACDQPSGYVADDGDCDDGDASVNPAAQEIWYDGVDQDCDGNDMDQDEDDFDLGQDCDDEDPAIHPDASEDCDGVDNDCDAQTDEGCDDTSTPGDDSGPSGDDSGLHGEQQGGDGGCSCIGRGAGGTYNLVLAVPLLLVRRRRWLWCCTRAGVER